MTKNPWNDAVREAEVRRHARHELLLHDDRVLRVARTHAPAAQHGRIDRRRRAELAEVRRRAGGGCAFAVGVRVQQVAVHDQVAVAAGGRLSRSTGDSCTLRTTVAPGFVDVYGRVVRRVRQVLAPVELQRRLAVAEHVVGDTHARREVVVRVHALRLRDRDRLRIQERRVRSCRSVRTARSSTRGPSAARPAA